MISINDEKIGKNQASDNFAGYYQRSTSKRSKDNSKQEPTVDEKGVINEIHLQVNQEVNRKLKESVNIQAAVPSAIMNPIHLPS